LPETKLGETAGPSGGLWSAKAMPAVASATTAIAKPAANLRMYRSSVVEVLSPSDLLTTQGIDVYWPKDQCGRPT
jgi:hypothetical protein